MKRMLLALAAAALATVGLTAVAFGAVSSLGIGSATVAPGGTATLTVTAVNTGSGVVGAWNVDVTYGSLVSLTTCTSATGICNPTFDSDTARLVGASASGIGGSVVLGTLTFTAGTATGVAALDVVVNQLTDELGTDLTVTATDGTITIAVPPTPSPTPVPTAAPTAAPTATPAAVPATGGSPSDSVGMSAWLLALVGLAIVSGGVWAVARTRR